MMNPAISTDLLFALLGLAAGNIINALALRTLAGQSWFSAANHCPQCHHELSFADQIPILSFLLFKGNCRHGKHPIHWQYPLVELATAVMFVAFVQKWEPGWYLLGMLALGCTLIAVSVTDIKERVIPHDITYPAILVGLVFSTVMRNDLIGSMAGVGAGYIAFDFLAHYGLKFYLATAAGKMRMNAALQKSDEPASASDPAAGDIQVIGGGDAVLAAVIAAWLGWQKLVIAVSVSAVVGVIIGTIVLLNELRRSGNLSKYAYSISLSMIIGFLITGLPVAAMGQFRPGALSLAFPLGLVGALIGLLITINSLAPGASKPFPFGPALAAGGFVAMCCL